MYTYVSKFKIKSDFISTKWTAKSNLKVFKAESVEYIYIGILYQGKYLNIVPKISYDAVIAFEKNR